MGDMTVEELKDKNLWFLWSAKPGKNGKVTKVPFAANGGATGTDDAHKGTWVSFDDAESARNQFRASGLGLKIPKGFFLLDIDHKDISDPFAQLMLSRFSSYAEVSPSGKGIHIIGQCDITKLPVHFDDRRKKLVLDSEYYQKRSDIGLELYIGDITNRYGTFTGNTINSLPIADCTQAVLTTLDKEMRKKPKAKYSAKRDGGRAVFDIVCDLRKQKNGDKFIRLYDKGDFSEYGSQSEADAALCALIAFRTGADPDAIDEVFRSSALYRSKWERDDYRENTINAGISACNGVFHRSKMEHPDFIKFNEQTGEPYVSVPLLAKYVREHLQYILVRDNGKQGLLKYVYEGGCYRLYADNMLLGIIKKYIADYDEELVKMSKVNEVLLHITTDLTYVSPDSLNADEDIINFQNGILKITATDTELIPHSADILSTIQLPCEWSNEDILVKNPFGFQLAGVLVNDAVTREAISKDQMRKSLKFVHDDVVYCKYYEVVYILFHTGMRISEFCGLTLKDIDLENRTINIDHQLQRTSDMRYIIETTKTDAGTRVLPITEDVAQMFQAIIEDRNAPKVEKAIDGYSGFLFYDDNGMPLVAMHWQHRFNHMVGRYNDIYRVQMPNITPHVCRHTYCSNMAKSGMNPKTLQYLMGHSDISVTMNVYTHIGFDDAEEELKRMEEFQKAQAEIEKKNDAKAVSQKMFKVV